MIKKIPVTAVQLGMYIHELHGSWLEHPFWKKRFLLEDPADLAALQKSGIREVSVDFAKSRVKPPSSATASHTGAPLSVPGPEEVPLPAGRPAKVELHKELHRAKKLCDAAKHAVVDMFRQARMGQAFSMDSAHQLVEQINESIVRHPHALITLARLKTADDYTYMHSVAVCAMMIALARQLGLTEDEINEAGAAGLLHDVGKMAIPEPILNKPGSLTDEEFGVVKRHPERGRDLLIKAGMTSTIVIDACLHHHEKYDGSGYPHGLAGEHISRLARMAAICDVYDAITSDRPYKKGWGPAESLQRMASWRGHFDPVYFQAFVKTLGIYPIGSLVRLKSQRLAVVIEQNAKSLVKPLVKVFFSVRSGLPLTPILLDLAARDVEDEIVAKEAAEDWNFPYLNELWQTQV